MSEDMKREARELIQNRFAETSEEDERHACSLLLAELGQDSDKAQVLARIIVSLGDGKLGGVVVDLKLGAVNLMPALGDKDLAH
jgi:hypothetical protein